jgi:diacylglycerol kinase family enzyme
MHIRARWRLAAALTLLVYGLLVALCLWWLAHNILLAAALVVAAVCLAAGGWFLFTGSSKRVLEGYLAVITGILLALAAVLYSARVTDALGSIAAIVALTGAYLILLSFLRKQYWSRARQQGGRSGQPQFRMPFLIVNPKAGSGRAIRAHIPQRAEDMGVHVLLTQKDVNVETTARQAVAQGADVLGVSGGDGTLGAVAKVAIEHQLPIVVLPGGTRCHFARDIGLSPKRITDALQAFHGIERQIDVANINGRTVLNNVAFGLYANIIDHPDYREHKREVSRRVLRDIVAGKQDAYPFDFHHNDQHFSKAVQILVGVNRYTTLKIFELGHRERMDEGVLHITAITQLNDSMVRKLLGAMSIGRLRGNHTLPDVYQWVAQTFRVDSPSSMVVVGVDGEREEYATPITITVMPGALRVLVPAEGVRGRSKNPFGRFMAHELWRATFRKRE